MSVPFAFEHVSEQRRSVYCKLLCLEPKYFAGDFPVTSRTFRGTWPHGVTFSRSAEICSDRKPLNKTQLQDSCKKCTSEHHGLFLLSCLGSLFVRSGRGGRWDMPAPSRWSPGGQGRHGTRLPSAWLSSQASSQTG